MKTIITPLVLLAVLTMGLSKITYALNEKYIEAMKKNIQALYQAKTVEEKQAVINTLLRIAEAEKTQWEPYYYAAFGYAMVAAGEEDPAGKDAYLDRAMENINRAIKISSEESEIVALQGFVHMLRVSVDPASRGPQFAIQAMRAFQKAVALNDNNPRAWALMARMQMGTAEFFGSPLDEACETLQKAIEKFDTFKTENPLAPQWGKSMIDEMKERCP